MKIFNPLGFKDNLRENKETKTRLINNFLFKFLYQTNNMKKESRPSPFLFFSLLNNNQIKPKANIGLGV